MGAAVKNKYEMDMCNGPLLKKLVLFSIPLMISSNLQLLFNAVDVIVVGKFSGQQALAAVGSTTSLINLIIMIMVGISLGSSVLAGQFFATNDKERMQAVVHTSVLFSALVGVFLAIVGITASEWALKLMDTPSEILEQATLYMRVYFIGMPFFMLYTYGSAVLRAVGDTKRPLIFLAIAGVLNVLLNLLMVIVFHMGVLGVAIATVVSEFVSCALVVRCLMKTDGIYRLSMKKLSINGKCLLQMFRIGLPSGLQSFVINFSNVLLQSSVNSFGEAAVAGYTAANSIFGFMFVTTNSFTQTCMSFTSQNFAVNNQKRMMQVLRDCMFLAVGTMLVFGLCVFLFSEQFLSIYTSSEEAIQCGKEIFLYSTLTYFFCSLMDLIPGAMRGFGYATVPMILSVIGTVGTRIFWIYCIFPTHHRLDILFISYPLSWAITVVLQVICFFFVWKHLKKKNPIVQPVPETK